MLGRVVKGCVMGPVKGSRVGRERCREYYGRWRDCAREWAGRMEGVRGKVRMAALVGRERRRDKEREMERMAREEERRKWREEVERVKRGLEGRERDVERRLEEVRFKTQPGSLFPVSLSISLVLTPPLPQGRLSREVRPREAQIRNEGRASPHR